MVQFLLPLCARFLFYFYFYLFLNLIFHIPLKQTNVFYLTDFREREATSVVVNLLTRVEEIIPKWKVVPTKDVMLHLVLKQYSYVKLNRCIVVLLAIWLLRHCRHFNVILTLVLNWYNKANLWLQVLAYFILQSRVKLH